MILTLKQKKEIRNLAVTIHAGVNFLVEQCEYGNDYRHGINHVLTHQIASVVGNLFNTNVVDGDTVSDYMKFYNKTSRKFISKYIIVDIIEARILLYVTSKDFDNVLKEMS